MSETVCKGGSTPQDPCIPAHPGVTLRCPPTRACASAQVQVLPTAGNGTNLWTRRRVAGVNLLAF